MTPFAEELARLEGRPVDEPEWRAAMWRRAYCVALNAVKVLDARLAAARREHFYPPMKFFYPPTED